GVTNESDAKTDPAADQDEEQGVVFNPNNWELDGQGVITVTVHGESGYLVAWIDWDGNGDFLGTGELIIRSAVVTGTNVLTFSIPIAATTDPLIFMRIRLFSEAPLVPQLSYVGLATNGEVQDKSFDNPFNPTAIKLAAFEATPQDNGILVTWETAMELDNVGFNLYRSTAAAGPYTKLNATLIPPQFPGEVMGGYYEWLDTDVEPGVVYYYKLEDLDVKGVSTLHGPISTAGVTVPTAVHLQRIDGRSVMTPLALGLVAVMGLLVVRRRRR
ncbi:MAG: hypothetical protein JXR84_10730, partial [Anaerolineae bacterium]|nr:hypothetical protein [Anaerolineae bacterium]